jgi:hypothetical protein
MAGTMSKDELIALLKYSFPFQRISVASTSYFAGNVGIGKSASAYPLDVATGTVANYSRILGTGNANTGLIIERAEVGGAYNDAWYWYMGAGSKNLILYNNGTGANRIAITPSGSIGFGADPTSKLQVVGLPVYANNAAAVAAGLTAGAFYRTNGDPDQVCVTH